MLIVQTKRLKLYADSNSEQEYNRYIGMLSGNQVTTVSSEEVHKCIAQRVCASLGRQSVYRIIHDGCDIRKPDSTDLEYLGTDVRSLEGKLIRGYKSMNSILIDTDNQSVTLLHHELYSNKVPNYIGETALKNPDTLTKEQQVLVEEKTYINTKVAFYRSAKISSDLLKSTDAKAVCLHIADRGHDEADTFAYLGTTLKDLFIIRCKDTRLSHLTYETYTLSGKLSKRRAQYKLIDKQFAHTGSYQAQSITIKGKVYRDVTVKIDWESLKIDDQTYTAVRCTLISNDKPVFKQPMLLITNCTVETIEQAKEVYLNYCLRTKIEVVFRFLKQNLGWETFQVRDFNCIKNLLALAFFLAGYFDELKDALSDDPLILQICALANSKGVISTHFILKGLAILAAAQLVEQWKQQHNITQQDIERLLVHFSP